ncbi:MAG: FMN-binding protein [Oenococcus kitaharae]|nr:FMN-binding protein [Oenococcus kitaharae]
MALAIDGYLLFFKKESSQSLANSTSSSAQAETSDNQTASSNSTVSQSSSVGNGSGYKDGTYTGEVGTMKWGDVQVKVTINNNKITQVQTIQYPTDNPHDQEINSNVLPTYENEAVTSNSAKIQSVSGATETWKGFKESLQSALNKAES